MYDALDVVTECPDWESRTLFDPLQTLPLSKKVIGRMCKIIDKTCLSPTPTLEQHLMWDDIAILARYMLMLSFNNSLDVAAHLPYLFHVVTLLVATGPLSLRASTHGLVINIIHSLCTCSQLNFSGDLSTSIEGECFVLGGWCDLFFFWSFQRKRSRSWGWAWPNSPCPSSTCCSALARSSQPPSLPSAPATGTAPSRRAPTRGRPSPCPPWRPSPRPYWRSWRSEFFYI